MQGNLKTRFFALFLIVGLVLVLLSVFMGRSIFSKELLATANNVANPSQTSKAVSGENEDSEGEEEDENSPTTQTIELQGKRGKILDRNGQPMAYNVPSYNVQFIRENEERKKEAYRSLYTEVMIKTIEIIERNGGKTIDTFPIKKDAQGEMYFDWNTESEAIAAKRDKNWRNLMNIGEDDSIETAYNYLRNWLFIPESMLFEDAVKVMSIWQEVQLNSGKSYLPITVAENVSEETVAEIETRSNELEGMQTIRTTMRVYPRGELTSHIVGYTTKMSALDDAEDYREKGYAYDDRVGIYGIEATQEDYLTGSTYEHHGKRVLEVTRSGQVIRPLEFQAASDGADVVTTIDTDLQQVLYNGLKKNIEQSAKDGKARLYHPKLMDGYIELLEKQGQGRTLDDVKTAKEGAAVVIEVNTGNVLALANVPSFDNNDFIRGMTSEEYKEKYAKEEEGEYPLLNRAIASATAPGSVFKMATGWAGLAEGVITVDEKISDEGAYSVSVDPVTNEPTFVGAPHCWIDPRKIDQHTDQNITAALKNSCNYYFFTVADRLKIDRLTYWTSQLGFDSKTNVELTSERAGKIGGQKTLFDNEQPINMNLLPGLVYRSVVDKLKSYCDEINIKYTDDQLEKCATELLKLADDQRANDEYGEPIRQIMQEELGIPQVVSSTRRWSYDIASDLLELVWNRSLTVRTGIGQSVMQVTPIAAARYVAALVNGGTVYDATIIDRVIDQDGKTLYKSEPKIFGTMEEDDNLEYHLSYIKEGMREVFSEEDGGSAGTRFNDFEYKDQIGGKTGTAQMTLKNNIDVENTAWMVVFVPYEDPEIVIAVNIPNGVAGAWCDLVVKDVVKYYMDRKNAVVKSNVDEINGLVS